jgi:hypothetical protein
MENSFRDASDHIEQYLNDGAAKLSGSAQIATTHLVLPIVVRTCPRANTSLVKASRYRCTRSCAQPWSQSALPNSSWSSRLCSEPRVRSDRQRSEAPLGASLGGKRFWRVATAAALASVIWVAAHYSSAWLAAIVSFALPTILSTLISQKVPAVVGARQRYRFAECRGRGRHWLLQ